MPSHKLESIEVSEGKFACPKDLSDWHVDGDSFVPLLD